MVDILVNGQLVGIVAEHVAKVFLGTLINILPNEFVVESKAHADSEKEKK